MFSGGYQEISGMKWVTEEGSKLRDGEMERQQSFHTTLLVYGGPTTIFL